MKKIFLTAAAALLGIFASAQTLSMAHVNSTELVQLCPEADQVRTELAAMAKDNQTVMEEMYQEYQTKADSFQKNSDKWTEAVRQTKAKELQDIQNRLNETYESIQQEMQQIERQKWAPIYQKANEVISELAKAKKVTYVVDAQNLLYVDESTSMDLTPEARVKMNIPAGRTLETLAAELQAQQQAE